MARGAGMAGSSSMARPFARYVSFNVLGMVGVSVYILADTFFIANGVGSDGLAALNFSIVLYTVLQATGLMLGIGAATEFQVCSACGDRTGANRVFTTALVMAGVAAVSYTHLLHSAQMFHVKHSAGKSSRCCKSRQRVASRRGTLFSGIACSSTIGGCLLYTSRCV